MESIEMSGKSLVNPAYSWFKNTFSSEGRSPIALSLVLFSGLTLMGAGSYYYFSTKTKSDSLTSNN
jgi:hypothetical protein